MRVDTARGGGLATVESRGWRLVGAETMRALDRHTIEGLGVPGEVLMESAGRAIAEAALALLGAGGRVFAVCGAGHNGGDGSVAARHLHLRGVPVELVPQGDPAQLSGDAAANHARARACGVPLGGPRFRAREGDVVIDAVFGTGLSRNVEGDAAALLRRIDRSRPAARVVAADLPSGIDTDTGQVLGVAVHADVTITIGLPKLALALEPGRAHAGRIVVARIGIADEAPGVEPDARVLTRAVAGALLPARPAAGHKGTFGHLLVVAGAVGKTGAAALAARGALRAGAGLVTVGCPRSAQPVLAQKLTEAMTLPLEEDDAGEPSELSAAAVLKSAEDRSALVLGPGIGRGPGARALARRVALEAAVPLALDADGLMAFAGEAHALRSAAGPRVLTPHPGEAGALLGRTPAEVNADRIGAARELAESTGAVTVLKGAATVIADPEGAVFVNPTGGPVLGSGGTGDVLAGVVGGLLAQGAAPLDAAALGAFWHGLAGDRVAERLGPAGGLAHEVADALPEAAHLLRDAARTRAPWAHARDALDFPGTG